MKPISGDPAAAVVCRLHARSAAAARARDEALPALKAERQANRAKDRLLTAGNVALDATSGGIQPVETAQLCDDWVGLRTRYPREFLAAAP